MEDQVQKTVNPNDQPNDQTIVASSPNKEAGASFIRQSEPEPVLQPEVSAAGVETVPEVPKLDQVHEKIGVNLPSESTPVNLNSQAKVQVSMTDPEIEEAIKNENMNFDINEQKEGIYFVNARYALAIFLGKLKKFHRQLTNQPV